MKKIGLLIVFLLAGVLAATFASAEPCYGTMVCGKVYWEGTDPLQPVASADVSVDCNGNVLTATTSSGGQYCVCYDLYECDAGDTATATATKEDASGNNSGVVEGTGCGINIGIVNILIPEFSAAAAGVALIGAGLGFIFLRRKK